MGVIGESRGRLVLAVKARPGARATRIVAVVNDELVVDVAAPPEDGKATRELLHFLARSTRLGRSEVELVSGAVARHKLVAFPLDARPALLDLLAPLGYKIPQ